MVDNYKIMFNEPPKEYHAPMEKGDQPELNDTPKLGPDGIEKYLRQIARLRQRQSLDCGQVICFGDLQFGVVLQGQPIDFDDILSACGTHPDQGQQQAGQCQPEMCRK